MVTRAGPKHQSVNVFIKFQSTKESYEMNTRDPIIHRVHAPTKANDCVKLYEQNPLNTVGCRVVTRAGQMDKQKDRYRRAGQYPTAQMSKMSRGWKWNNWYHLHFYCNYHIVYFQLKTNSVGIIEVSVIPMANTMYFIQWIVTLYQNGYKS